LKRVVASQAQRDRLRYHLAEVFGAKLAVVQPPLQLLQARLFGPDQQLAQARVCGRVSVGPLVGRRLTR